MDSTKLCKDSMSVSILNDNNNVKAVPIKQIAPDLKIVSATVDFSTTPAAENSNLYKAVTALQGLAEIYYVGKPGNTATGFVALVNVNKTDIGDGYATYGSDDGSYENLEDVIRAALGTAENDVTVTNITLTGLTFA
jgi:hypothetical protein